MFKRILLSSLVLAAGIGFAALPDLNQADRESMANLIVKGKVVKVTKTLQDVGHGDQDWVFTAALEVSTVQKGDQELGLLEITYSKPAKRPKNWVGPQGQKLLPRVNDEGVFYLQPMNSTTAWRLLEPNGWDKHASALQETYIDHDDLDLDLDLDMGWRYDVGDELHHHAAEDHEF